MTHCLSILIKALLVKSCRKCKETNIGTSRGLKLVNGLNGPDDTRRRNIDLNKETGEINIQTDQSGEYELKINTRSVILHKKLHINIRGKMKTVSVKEGESITLHTGLIEMQGYGLILWKFKDQLIAEINKVTNQFLTHDTSEEIFKGRLQLSEQSGSLTISDSRTTDSGVYHLKMSNSTHTVQSIISVSVSGVFGVDVSLSVMKGDSVTLKPLTEIPEDDTAQWWFGSKIIARINKASGRFSTSEGDDVGFNGKLNLDHQTGSLTITNITTDHTGLYKLQIRSKTETIKIFSVTVRGGVPDKQTPDPGLSPGVVTGIVVAVLVLVFAAAVAGVIYRRWKISKLKRPTDVAVKNKTNVPFNETVLVTANSDD